MIAPYLFARAYSLSGVTFDENIILSPENPIASASMSSVADEQSQPQPYSPSIFIRVGFGVAFTAKYSRKPLFHANAFFTFSAFFLMPASSYT